VVAFISPKNKIESSTLSVSFFINLQKKLISDQGERNNLVENYNEIFKWKE